MFAATRKLIAARQRYSDFIIAPVKVKQIGGGLENDCLENATRAIDRDPSLMLVTGWMVSKYDPTLNVTEITAHFWNSTRSRELFDLTPCDDGEYEYVVDTAISEFYKRHGHRYSSTVCSSLILKNDSFMIVSGDHKNGLSYRPAPNLSTEELFRDLLIKK